MLASQAMRLRWMDLASLVAWSGLLLLTGCSAAASLPTLLFLLAVALGAGASGCRDGGGIIRGSIDDCFNDADFDRSLLPGEAPASWELCCLRGQSRMCPPSPPSTACNYGRLTTFNADGTCQFDFLTTDSGSNGDAQRDAAPDLGFVGCLSDSTFDMSMPEDSAPAGWSRCCLRQQTRACPPGPPTGVCNYGWGTFCPDGRCNVPCDQDAAVSDASSEGLPGI